MTDENLLFDTDETRNWLKSILREQNLTVEFVKKDGTVRKMLCTLSESEIPAEKHPKNSGKEKNDDVCSVFDIEKLEWRSFRWDSVKKIEFNFNSFDQGDE